MRVQLLPTIVLAVALVIGCSEQKLPPDIVSVSSGTTSESKEASSTDLNNLLKFLEEKPLNVSGMGGHAELRVQADAKVDEVVSADILFYNETSGYSFYNPYLDPFAPYPCALALYDSSEKYIGDLLNQAGGMRQVVALPKNWVNVPSGSYAGRRVRFSTKWLPSNGHKLQPFPPGDYYLQVIFYTPFIATNPSQLARSPGRTVEEAIEDFRESFSKTELFRSNVVKLTVVEKEGP